MVIIIVEIKKYSMIQIILTWISLSISF